MKKHAILIGINTIPDLGYLSAPTSYAVKMKAWAETQGYITHLFIDEPVDDLVSGKCSRIDILAVTKKIIDDGCDQLLIYFAGHGVERTIGDDVWLLPGYVDDPADCISIFLSQQLAFRTGIEHVIMISDACRSASDSASIRPITPSSLLPNRKNIDHRTAVDIFYSTWPGEDSTDLRDANTGEYRSIYSDSLLDCLHGNIPEIIKDIVNIRPKFPAVFSHELNDYLKKEVPEKMRLIGGILQYPMGTVSSSDPLYLSSFPLVDGDSEEEVIEETGLSVIIEPIFRPVETKKIDEKLESFIKLKGGRIKVQMQKILRDFKHDYNLFTSPAILNENITGLYITGNNNPMVLSSRENDMYLERKDFSVPVVLNFEDVLTGDRALYFVSNWRKNRFYPVNVIPGYLTQVVFEKHELLTVNYFPTDRNNKYDANFWATEVAERKAHIIMAAKNGMFQGTQEMGDYLRTYKHLDPTLGLFAAYAYFQKGDFDGLRDLYRFLLNHQHFILGDIQLLNKLSATNLDFERENEIPFPLLTEGWTYLNMLESNPYNFLSKQLQPGLWASFDRLGIDLISDFRNLRPI